MGRGKLKALFFRVNNKLYTYVVDNTWKAHKNIHLGAPLLLPKQMMRMFKGKMGPVLLHNTAREIHELYARAAREEPNWASNVQEAQDLNLYLHLWNTHKQEKKDIICITMKGWRPPVWAIKVAKQKKLALQERTVQQKGSALLQHKPATTNVLSNRTTTISSGIAPTPHLPLLRERLMSPEPGKVTMQGAVIGCHPQPPLMASLLPCASLVPSAAAPPAKKKNKGKPRPNNDLPPDMPPLSANINTWAHFMHQ